MRAGPDLASNHDFEQVRTTWPKNRLQSNVAQLSNIGKTGSFWVFGAQITRIMQIGAPKWLFFEGGEIS